MFRARNNRARRRGPRNATEPIRYDDSMMRLGTSKLALVAMTSWAMLACDGNRYREVNLDAKAAAPPLRASQTSGKALRVSVAAMLSPRDTYSSYSRLFERLGQRLGMEVELVQRRTYAEVNELLLAGRLDAALLCTGGYLELRERAPSQIEVAAVPLRDGKATYESLIIVPASSGAKALRDLAGRKFAFTDELSFSGYSYAAKLLRDMGEEPRHFFASITFTRSHDRSVNAVAQRLMDGAAVDSLIYEDLVRRDPGLGSATRVIHRSPPFGTMPVVVSTRLPVETRGRIREVLLGLDRDPETAETLRVLHIDRFVAPSSRLYDTAAAVVEARR
jgi:phosphonate transport system substrate-binding protein